MIAHLLAAPLAALAILVLLAAAAIHVFWALGGKFGSAAAIPEAKPGRGPLFKPSSPATMLVAAALVVIALMVAARIGALELGFPDWLVRGLCGASALVFLVRAIGDFRYVGFFKRVKGSRFARLDTMFFSPLCLLLALAIGSVVP